MSWHDQYKVELPEMENDSWRVERFEVSEDEARWHAMSTSFTPGSAGRGVPAGTYTKLLRKDPRPNGDVHNVTLVMSDTPAEIADHIGFIRKATGRLLIHGLGIGMCLRAVLAKPDVEHVDVVELSQPLLDLIAPHYQDPRVAFHCGDALTFAFPRGTRWNVVWHDIWDDICTDNWDVMKRLHRRYGRRCDWQGSWSRELVEYHLRQERNDLWCW